MNENPESPANPGTRDPEDEARRKFLERLSIVLGGSATLGLLVPSLGFILAPLFARNARAWRTVGAVDQFKLGETVAVRFEDASPLEWAGVTARTAAWLRREKDGKFTAFSINCTHLGCPVRWLAEAELFMCPCHGGVYYSDGTVAAGPPPQPLSRLPVRTTDGRVEILTVPLSITSK